MALILMFSSIPSLILGEELPKPEGLRHFGPYGRGPSQPNVRSGYNDGISGNKLLAERRHLIKNHNTGANENHHNLDTHRLYSNSDTNFNNNKLTRTNAHQNNINNGEHYQSTNNFPLSGTNSYNSNGFSSVHNNNYGGNYVSNSYSYEKHDDYVYQYGGGSGGTNMGSGNRGRDDIFNTHSGVRDPTADYGPSLSFEDFDNTGEYDSMDATRPGSPPETEINLNSVIHSNNKSTQRQGRLEDSINRQGHGGGYNVSKQLSTNSIDLYSLLALGLFAAFLGYVIFYYISTNRRRRRSFDGSLQDYATLIMPEVFNALERWTLVEHKPRLKNNDESKFLR